MLEHFVIDTITIMIVLKVVVEFKVWEARDYHQDGITAEYSLVRDSNNSKEDVGRLQEKELPSGPLPSGYDLPFLMYCRYNIWQKKSVRSITIMIMMMIIIIIIVITITIIIIIIKLLL